MDQGSPESCRMSLTQSPLPRNPSSSHHQQCVDFLSAAGTSFVSCPPLPTQQRCGHPVTRGNHNNNGRAASLWPPRSRTSLVLWRRHTGCPFPMPSRMLSLHEQHQSFVHRGATTHSRHSPGFAVQWAASSPPSEPSGSGKKPQTGWPCSVGRAFFGYFLSAMEPARIACLLDLV